MVSAPTCSIRPEPTGRLGGEFWVATDECGTVIATIGWRPLDAAVVELERLYVNPRWRRRGLANTLADLVERDGRRTAGERESSCGATLASRTPIASTRRAATSDRARTASSVT